MLGTKACDSPEFVSALVHDFHSRIVVGIDARNGVVAIKGWTKETTVTATDLAGQISRLGVQNIIFTDVSTDGMLAGPNYMAISAVCAAVTCNVVASGGIGNMMDVSRLRALGWSAPTDFETGMKEAYQWYVVNVAERSA